MQDSANLELAAKAKAAKESISYGILTRKSQFSKMIIGAMILNRNRKMFR